MNTCNFLLHFCSLLPLFVHFCTWSLTLLWSGEPDKYWILKPANHFENRTVFECDRGMFDFFILHGNAQPNFITMKGYEAKKERVLKLTYNKVCTKKELSYSLTISLHLSHFQIILTIWNYSGCHLYQVLFLDSINNPGTVFVWHKTVEMTTFKWE